MTSNELREWQARCKQSAHPTPEAIRAARGQRTQVDAGKLVYASERKWQRWEAGVSKMSPAVWELFQLKMGAPRDQENPSSTITKK
jgi:hypothetical protein